MKVLIIANAYPSVENPIPGVFVREQAIELKRSGIDVAVLNVELSKITSLFKIRSEIVFEKLDDIEVYRHTGINYLPKLHHFHRYVAGKYALKLFQQYVLKNGKPDLIHAHFGLWSGYSARFISKRFGIPYLVTEHTTYIAEGKYSLAELNNLSLVYQNAREIIVVSEGLKEKVKRYSGKTPLTIIPNSIDTNFFSPAVKVNDVKYIFSLGNLIPQKGFDVLIKAFAKASVLIPDVKLVIGGEGFLRNQLESLAKDLNVLEKIKFLGQISRIKVKEQMQNALVFASTSRFETFGVVVAEAMSCGIPVLVTRSGGPEFFVDSSAGLVCSNENIDEIADKLVVLIRNHHQFNGRQFVINRFSKEKISNDLKEMYMRVLL